MKKKIIALTLTAALALSSTSAFAATTTDCEKTFNYDLSNLLKGITSNSNVKQYKLTVNGQEMDLNSIDWNTVLNKTTTAVQKPASTEKTTAPEAAKPTATQPVAAKPAATTPAVTQPATPVATKPATTAPAAKPATTPAVTQPAAPVATQPAAPSTATTTPSNTVSSSNLSYEQKVAELVNIERQKAGLSALTFDQSVSNVARTKSKDMAANNYFAHQSPTYGSAGDMLTKFGIKWSAWGENIASGQKTPEAVVTAWMNSPGHRANILSTNFSKIGVGYAVNSNGTPYWTQIFTN
ncbi:MAG: CAP domain-containing protein [Sedimentibacter saalensis]|uniref:CAP domain-containing protein n=1 Tax=Sedimentibacter saalensis TaxID=130788 RepID=UPI003158D61D